MSTCHGPNLRNVSITSWCNTLCCTCIDAACLAPTHVHAKQPSPLLERRWCTMVPQVQLACKYGSRSRLHMKGQTWHAIPSFICSTPFHTHTCCSHFVHQDHAKCRKGGTRSITTECTFHRTLCPLFSSLGAHLFDTKHHRTIMLTPSRWTCRERGSCSGGAHRRLIRG